MAATDPSLRISGGKALSSRGPAGSARAVPGARRTRPASRASGQSSRRRARSVRARPTPGDAAWDAAALDAAREAAPDGALAAARKALETLDACASTRSAAAAIADPVRAALARLAAAGERAALVDLVGALAETAA